MIILPLVAWLLLVLRSREWFDDGRYAILFGSTLFGSLLVVISEALSLLDYLGTGGIALLWGVVIVSLGIPALRRSDQLVRELKASRFETRWWIPLTFIGGCTFLSGIVYPPNNWDSMTYHLPRALHWLQNESLAHYPTSILRQLFMPPFAELGILHVFALSNGDQLAFVVQWLSMAGSLLAVWVITEQMTSHRRAAITAVAFAATLPMGILQASSTQNDWVLTVWLAIATAFVLAYSRDPSTRWVIGAALAIGLALLTKGTGFIFAFPLLVLLVVGMIRRKPEPLAWIALILLPTLLVAGHFTRNLSLFGHPLGPRSQTYLNATVSGDIVISNTLRNLALHLATPVPGANDAVVDVVVSIHEWIRLSPDDPRSTYPNQSFSIGHDLIQEDFAPNPVHLLLLVTAAVTALLRSRRIQRDALLIAGIVVAGAFLFVLLVRWQPWHSRLHLPLFVLSAPFVGSVLTMWNRRATRATVVALYVASLPWLLLNFNRPLVMKPFLQGTETDFYFRARDEIRQQYQQSAKTIKGTECTTIGLDIGGDDWEYPLWMMLDRDGESISFRHVGVENESATLSNASVAAPCLVFARGGREISNVYDGGNYRALSRFDDATILVRELESSRLP